MLLKDVPNVLPKLENSIISKTKIWEKCVGNLVVQQLTAVRKLELIENKNSKIDEEIEYLVRQIQFAEIEGLCSSPLSLYTLPNESKIRSTEFVAGLKELPQQYRLAVVFGLEMGLSAIRTSNLTVQQAHNLANLTPLANDILRSCITSIKTVLQFWHHDETNDHVALDDLGEVVYGAFGCTWLELSKSYKNMISDHYDPLLFPL